MITERAFEISIQDFSVHQLTPEDSGSIQTLFENCLDFMLLVDGRPAGNDAAEETFQDLPPGKSLQDKFVFGIFDRQHKLVGLLEVVRGYPDNITWWIGLLLLSPESRSQGLGKQVLEGFVKYVSSNGGQVIMLGVVEENQRAYSFWESTGFEFVRKTEPKQFGNKIQTVSIMRRSLGMDIVNGNKAA